MNNSSSKPKILTAVGHSCGVVAFLGLFVALSSYSTDPHSTIVTVGLIMVAAGIVGFVLARMMARAFGA
jgi:hypothetical protein